MPKLLLAFEFAYLLLTTPEIFHFVTHNFGISKVNLRLMVLTAYISKLSEFHVFKGKVTCNTIKVSRLYFFSYLCYAYAIYIQWASKELIFLSLVTSSKPLTDIRVFQITMFLIFKTSYSLLFYMHLIFQKPDSL